MSFNLPTVSLSPPQHFLEPTILLSRSTTMHSVVSEKSMSFESTPLSTRFRTACKNSLERVTLSVSTRLGWATRNWSWAKAKPVIRCAVVAWALVLVFLSHPTRSFLSMGNTAYIVLIAPYLSPPSGPFLSVLEQQVMIVLFVAAAAAWASLGSYLAYLAREQKTFHPALSDVVRGRYMEVIPSVIIAVFLFIGTAAFLFIKARKGFAYFANYFSACICLDVSLVAAILFPYPVYSLAWSFAVSYSYNAVLSILGSILIFPYSISSQFTDRLQDIIEPLMSALESHRTLLSSLPDSPAFSAAADAISNSVKQCESGIVPLSAAARLLRSDVTYSRFSPDDLYPFRDLTRTLIGRANGLGVYPTLIDPSRAPFKSLATTPAPSVPPTSPPTPGPGIASGDATTFCASSTMRGDRSQTSHGSDEGSPSKSGQMTPTYPGTPNPFSMVPASVSRPPLFRNNSAGNYPVHNPHGQHHYSPYQSSSLRYHHQALHISLLSLKKSRAKKREHAVGLFVNQRYLDLEAARLHDPRAHDYVQQATSLLQRSCDDALAACSRGLLGVSQWLADMHDERFNYWAKSADRRDRFDERLKKIRELRDTVFLIIQDFKEQKRHLVIDPYRSAFDDGSSEGEEELQIPPHRYLFNCFVYQYHLMQMCEIVITMLDMIITKEVEREKVKLWTPVHRVLLWKWSVAESEDDSGQPADDDPDVIEGAEDFDGEERRFGLGVSNKRDPDALPPDNAVEWIMHFIYTFFVSLVGGNVLYGIKAGLFIVLLSLPVFLKSSAPWAYQNRYAWAIFMGQMTLARFRGDTAFELVVRILSTFFGGLVGICMWKLSQGTEVGIALVCALCLPAFFYVRLYCPIPPISNIIFFLTTFLVLGYSYQDGYLPEISSPGSGWPVAWKRFVFVTIGVCSAFCISFLPPSTTIRRYQRHLLSTTSSEIATIYSSIISYATLKQDSDVKRISASLIALQNKLKRAMYLKKNVSFEISLRGRWPASRYQQVADLESSISHGLSHLTSILQNLDPVWARAFLRRTRLADPDFQGDMIATISLVSLSLRTGAPLPHITPSPLLDRFMLKYHGLNVSHKEKDTEHALPVPLSLETLKNEQYLMFCVGISTAFGIISRMDRLMVAAKEIVGEQYHMYGLRTTKSGGGVDMGSRINSVHFDPPRDV